MWYLIVFIGLFATELFYFSIANQFGIIDRPNERSSHNTITLRGGGIIFSLSVLCFFLVRNFQYPFFMLGLSIITAISFADDLKHQGRILRIVIHFAAVALLMYQLQLFSYKWYWLLLGVIMIIGIINAYNFMDGINGLTTGYSFTVLVTSFILNTRLKIFDQDLIIFLALGNFVFAFFNFRKKAKCFAGDVGSVSMAFCLLFLTAGIGIYTKNIFFILMFAVYGVDSVVTIMHRLAKGENIFRAHRQHLFQYLANESKWPQLHVSAVYVIIQTVISAGVLLLWEKHIKFQVIYAAFVILILVLAYVVIKRKILSSVNANG